MITRISFPFLLSTASAFIVDTRSSHSRQTQHPDATPLRLIPLAKFDGSISFFSETDEYRCCIDDKGFFSGKDAGETDGFSSDFELGLIEEEELPDLCRFVVETFGAEAIQLSSDINSFERMLMSPAAEFLNGYSGMVAFAEVFSGTKQRVADRLASSTTTTTTTTTQHREDPTTDAAAAAAGTFAARTDSLIAVPDLKGLSYDERIRKAERDSMVLMLARRPPTDSTSSKTVDIIASIELRLQPCDAKIPFSIPWLDRVERRLGTFLGLGTDNLDNLQPYLSNLCVDERYRGQKIGRGLVRCVENIAETCWGYNRMYLHVDEDNLAALNLYKSEGYRDVGHRWNPFWSGGASDIGYYVKSLKNSKAP